MIKNWDQATNARYIVENSCEWRKWIKDMPYLNFKEEWNVKIIPPFSGAISRFQITHKNDDKTWVSIYLDCYDELGCYGEPYWELYPYFNGEYEDTFRCDMNDTKKLLNVIEEQLNIQVKNNKINKEDK